MPTAKPPLPVLPSFRTITREIHAFFNELSLRSDVTVSRNRIGPGMSGRPNINTLHKAGLPLEIIAAACDILDAEYVWDFTADMDGGLAGSSGGRFILPSYFNVRWQKPSPSYAFPKGSRHVLIDTHANEGYGYAFERKPGAALEYVFARAGEESDPIFIADSLESYLRRGLASGFAWYWQTGSKESKRVAQKLSQKAPLRQNVKVTVKSVRALSRAEAQRELFVRNGAVWAQGQLGLLGAPVPKRVKGKDDVSFDALRDAMDALPSRSDADVLGIHGAEPRAMERTLAHAEPTPANVRRALDISAFGPSQPAHFVELDLDVSPVGNGKSVDLFYRGSYVQALAGRPGSTIRAQLGEIEFWDFRSKYGQDSLALSRLVLMPLDLGVFSSSGPQPILVDAAAVAGIEAGESWLASVVERD